jgi:uncharacterized protein (DUF2062 family)
MLVCGVLMSLALGVLVAYGVCVGMFAVLEKRVRKAKAARVPAVAGKTVAAQLRTSGN